MTRRRWTSAILWAASAAALPPRAATAQAIPGEPPPPAVAAAPVATATAGPILEQDPDKLGNVLLGNGASPDDRTAAAARLVALRSDAAAQVLAQALQSDNADAATAAVKALSDSGWKDRRFVAAIEATLGRNEALNTYAGQALTQYADDPQVAQRLIGVGRNGRIGAAARTPVVRALGAFPDKSAADFLVARLEDLEENSAVRHAAGAALVDMTGLREYGQDVEAWQAWWNARKNLPPGPGPGTFADDVRSQRAARFADVVQRSARLERGLDKLLKNLYFTSPAADQPHVLGDYLANEAPEIRRTGAEIVEIDVEGGKPMTGESRDRLLAMLADDPASEVRVVAARALGLDPANAPALLRQLAHETNPDVQITLLNALAPRRDPDVMARALGLLGSPSFRVARAAADAIARGGAGLRDPRQAPLEERVKAALLSALQRTSAPGAEDFGRSVTAALASLADPGLGPALRTLSGPDQPDGVRIYAIAGLGELSRTNSDVAGVVADFVDSPNTPAAVRLAAVQALAKAPTTAHVERLVDRLNLRPDPDADVRKAIWETVKALFPLLMDEGKLETLAERRLKNEQDYAHEADVRRYLALRLEGQNTPDALQAAASQRETLGTLELDKLNQPADAAVDFAKALDYYEKTGGPLNPARGEARALIKTGPPYDAAVKFAADTLNDPKRAEVVPDVLGEFSLAATQLANNAGDRDSLNKALDLVKVFKAAGLNLTKLPYVLDDLDAAAQIAKRNLEGLGSG